jgi:predicted permease
MLISIGRAVYLPIFTAVALGYLLSLGLARLGAARRPALPGVLRQAKRLPQLLSGYLFLVGIPLTVVNFVRAADLSLTVFIAPIVAWMAMLLAIVITWASLHVSTRVSSPGERGSLLLSYIGNTSYLGFPVILFLPQLGPDYLSVAVLYDVLGTFFGAYVLGLVLASMHSGEAPTGVPFWQQGLREVLRNPSLYAFALGLALRPVPLPRELLTRLGGVAWLSIMLCLVVMGIRLQQLSSRDSMDSAMRPGLFKLLIVPLVIAAGLTAFGVDGLARLVLILQASMPCGVATGGVGRTLWARPGSGGRLRWAEHPVAGVHRSTVGLGLHQLVMSKQIGCRFSQKARLIQISSPNLRLTPPPNLPVKVVASAYVAARPRRLVQPRLRPSVARPAKPRPGCRTAGNHSR